MIWQNEIEEARIILWSEFDTVPDKSIEMMIFSFKLIARMIVEGIEKEGG